MKYTQSVKNVKKPGSTNKQQSKYQYTILCLATQPGYELKKQLGRAGKLLVFKGQTVARCFRKREFYQFLEEQHIDWRQSVSKKLNLDAGLIVYHSKTLYLVEEMLKQPTFTSYRKLQTCDFKRKQYIKLVSPLGLRVEYIYVLNDWFKKPEYRDVLDYIQSVNCHYKFNSLPLSWLGLPEPK